MLEIRNLKIAFGSQEAVHGISLSMSAGERLGLVGESGSGKTVTALTVAGLLDRRHVSVSGEVLFKGRDILQCSDSELQAIRGRDISMVFQEPMTSLDPLMRVGRQVEEPLRLHMDLPRARCHELAVEVLGKVGLPEPEECCKKYPHQLSGGQRQRVMIASAFITDPALLIADEPTTALDVTVQSQILELLCRINQRRGIGLLFISHDLNVVRRVCTRVAVMCRGEIVETGAVEEIFNNPQHEYTKRLIAAIPTRERRRR